MKDWRDNPKFKFTEEEKRKARLEEKKSDAKMKIIILVILTWCYVIYKKFIN